MTDDVEFIERVSFTLRRRAAISAVSLTTTFAQRMIASSTSGITGSICRLVRTFVRAACRSSETFLAAVVAASLVADVNWRGSLALAPTEVDSFAPAEIDSFAPAGINS
eukprot:4314199-Pleurochrysis_carterae.AAC.5